MMRSKKAFYNFVTSILLEFFTILSGFILPNLLISSYGSVLYGLTTSITQFMGFLTLLQSGVGGVIRAALYKPLADNDSDKLSSVLVATGSFFRKIALVGCLYTGVLVMGFGIQTDEFSFGYVASMVIIISSGILMQYCFGITNQMLLQADQKSYIYTLIQLVCTIANVILVVIAVWFGAGIHVAKLLSTIVFAIRPLVIYLYVKQKYRINYGINKDMSLISQRWDGFGQTVAYFVHTKIDVFLITAFLSYVHVSVYSIYALVTTALTSFISSISNAVQAAFGNMIAKGETEHLKNRFTAYTTLVHIVATVVFTTAIIMVIPFIRIYTLGFADNSVYIDPILGIALLLAECMFCYRLPYQTVIISSGHYKQTRKGAYIEAAINVFLSVLLIQPFGMIGIAFATLFAMVYRTIDYGFYLKNNIVGIPMTIFAKHMKINVILLLEASAISMLFRECMPGSIMSWCVVAAVVFVVQTILTAILNLVWFRQDIMVIVKLIMRKSIRKRANNKTNDYLC